MFPIKTPLVIYRVLEFWSGWDWISSRLELHLNQAESNNVMKYVMILSPKMRRNEWLWRILDIGNMFRPTFGFKNNFNLRNKITKKITILLISIVLHGKKLHRLIVENLLSDRLWAPRLSNVAWYIGVLREVSLFCCLLM